MNIVKSFLHCVSALNDLVNVNRRPVSMLDDDVVTDFDNHSSSAYLAQQQLRTGENMVRFVRTTVCRIICHDFKFVMASSLLFSSIELGAI